MQIFENDLERRLNMTFVDEGIKAPKTCNN